MPTSICMVQFNKEFLRNICSIQLISHYLILSFKLTESRFIEYEIYTISTIEKGLVGNVSRNLFNISFLFENDMLSCTSDLKIVVLVLFTNEYVYWSVSNN